MSDTIKIWLEQLYIDTIADVKATIKNEEVMYLGGNEYGKENLEQLHEYLTVLEELKENVSK